MAYSQIPPEIRPAFEAETVERAVIEAVIKQLRPLFRDFGTEINPLRIQQQTIGNVLSRPISGAELQPITIRLFTDAQLIHGPSHNSHTGKIILLQPFQFESYGSCTIRPADLLSKRIAGFAETRCRLGIDTEITRPVGQAPLFFVRNMVELPDLRQLSGIEIIGMLRIRDALSCSDRRFAIRYHPFSGSSFRSYYRPVVFPFHRI